MHQPPSTCPREKQRRLPAENYRGRIRVAFTACVNDHGVLFDDAKVVIVFVAALDEALAKLSCTAPVYCFMPDHLHVIIQGETETSDVRGAMAAFKQKTGFWLRRHCPHASWQKDFCDHVICSGEDLVQQVRYVAENPVRRGLVREWHEYPFTGAIGHDLGEVLVDSSFSEGR
jgi:putative transposase